MFMLKLSELVPGNTSFDKLCLSYFDEFEKSIYITWQISKAAGNSALFKA